VNNAVAEYQGQAKDNIAGKCYPVIILSTNKTVFVKLISFSYNNPAGCCDSAEERGDHDHQENFFKMNGDICLTP
jgi:hypothetical protein